MDIALREKAYCTYEEKLSCLSIVSKILKYIEMVRNGGTLVLEEEMKSEENLLLTRGVARIIDGRESGMIMRELENYIVFSNFTGAELLKNLIVLEGVLLIHAGVHPDLSKAVLLSYFGLDGEAMYASMYTE